MKSLQPETCVIILYKELIWVIMLPDDIDLLSSKGMKLITRGGYRTVATYDVMAQFLFQEIIFQEDRSVNKTHTHTKLYCLLQEIAVNQFLWANSLFLWANSSPIRKTERSLVQRVHMSYNILLIKILTLPCPPILNY